MGKKTEDELWEGLEEPKEELKNDRKNYIRRYMASDKMILLFFSVDIVNSTRYKAENPGRWAKSFTNIMEMIVREVKEKVKGAIFWKMNGDEALFYVSVTQRKELLPLVEQIDSVISSAADRVDDARVKNGIRSHISLQGTAWLANVSVDGSIATLKRNLFIPFEKEDGYLPEFLGPEIDIGFRISGETREKQLVLSFELSYLLSQEKDGCDRLRILELKELHGVWSGDTYPIIWFHNRNRDLMEDMPIDVFCDMNRKPEYRLFESAEQKRYLLEGLREARKNWSDLEIILLNLK